jgi:disulfide bond formation protein DsbB
MTIDSTIIAAIITGIATIIAAYLTISRRPGGGSMQQQQSSITINNPQNFPDTNHAIGPSGLLSRRLVNTLGFLGCTALLGYAFYLEYVEGLEPCPLCMFQRIAFIVLGIVFLVAALHNTKGWGGKIYSLLILLAAGAGAALATRHIWLQSLPPDKVPECGPDLDYMLETFPLMEMITTVLNSSGYCAEINWQFLGIAMPGWALIMFIFLGLFGVIRNWART